jgi:uncharacterized lipoprotein
MKTMMRAAFAVLAALTMAACAGNTRGSDRDNAPDEFLRVVVENGGTIPTQIRLYLVPREGPEALLGTMTTLGTETMSTTLPNISGMYRLRAEGGTRYVLMSPRVTLRGNETIRWDMRQNVIRLGEQ